MSGYIGNIPTPQATQSRQSFTATAGQTTFATVGYSPGFLDVYLNGVHLLDGTDYTATNGSDIVLTVGAALDDVVECVAYETFSVLDQSFTGTTTTEDLTTTGAFTSLGIDDNATSTAMTLDASGNVGIGTAAPNELFEIEGGNMRFTNTVSNDSRIYFTHSPTANRRAYIGALETSGNGNSLIFAPNANGFDASEAMRINTSGGVIVGATDPSYGGAVAGDVVTTGGLNLNGMHVVKSKYMNLTTTTQDILLCGLRATYKITMSACDPSSGAYRGSQTAWVSVSNNYAGQGTTITNVGGNLVLGWKAGSGYSTSSRTLTARTTSSTANAWVITVEIQSNYAKSAEGSTAGMCQFLI